jgi:hypothetical protein
MSPASLLHATHDPIPARPIQCILARLHSKGTTVAFPSRTRKTPRKMSDKGKVGARVRENLKEMEVLEGGSKRRNTGHFWNQYSRREDAEQKGGEKRTWLAIIQVDATLRETPSWEDTNHDRRFLRDGLALAPDPAPVPFMPECRGPFGVPPRMVARDCDESIRVGGVGPRGSRRAWADGGE